MKQAMRIVTALLLPPIAALHGADGPRPERPNILFVFADQLRSSATGYGGDLNVHTPRIDGLAGESINFRNAVSVCPVCTPYRAALMTGRFPTTTGMFLNDACLPARELCIAEVLSEAGYDTGYIGKWHLDGHGRKALVAPERRQGFEYWKAGECDHDYNKSHYYSGAGTEQRFWEGYDAFAETRDARQYLGDRPRGGKPFALFLSYGIPHFPHGSAPDQFKGIYPPEKLRFLPNVPAENQTDKVRTEAQGYYAHTAALDQCIGELVGALKDLGLAEDTILVFTSDHGEMMGSHGIKPFTKQVPWDESVHVPFLIRYPRAHGASGRVVATPLTTPDIMPTLLALAGVPIPATVEGTDLSSLVRGGGENPGHVALFMNVSPFAGKGSNTPYRAIRTAQHTYVRNLEGPWLAFDDGKDPSQMTNLVGQPAQAALCRDLDERLQAALKGIRDDFRPPAFYVEKFGYELAPHGSVSYAPGAKVQSPRDVGPLK